MGDRHEYSGNLIGKIQNAAAPIKHDQQGDQEKEEHEQVQDEITFTACVFYIVHNGLDCNELNSAAKV